MHKGLKLLTSLAVVGSAAATNYVLKDDYQPSTYADNFTIFTEPDPSNGYVEYVDGETASKEGLLGVKDNALYLGVDHEHVADITGRKSVRLQTKNTFAHGLVVADIGHMPKDVCGTWPAFWTTGAKWPEDGEIDIIEGVNVQDHLESALHTGPGCKVQKNQDMVGNMSTDDCNVHAQGQAGNQGCLVEGPKGTGYGDAFNKANGGVLATEISKDAVSIWYFPRSEIPKELGTQSSDVDTSKWGKPMSKFSGECDFEKSIKDQSVVFNIDFCGDWAKNMWKQSGCSAKASVCEDYVKNHPKDFEEVYWSINWLKIYQQSAGTPAAASSVPAGPPGQSPSQAGGSSPTVPAGNAPRDAGLARTPSVPGNIRRDFPTTIVTRPVSKAAT